VLGQDHMLEDTILIHYLVDIVTRGHLDRERDWRLMTCAHHLDSGWTLDHLNLLTKLQTHSLALVNMKVNSVLTMTWSLVSSTGTHGHCDSGTRSWLMVTIDDWCGVAGVIGRVSTRRRGRIVTRVVTIAHWLPAHVSRRRKVVTTWLVIVDHRSGEGAHCCSGHVWSLSVDWV